MELLINLRPGRRGEIVFCQPDGASYGALERLDTFLVVRVDGITEAEVMAVGPGPDDETPGGRLYKFDVDAAFTSEELSAIRASDWSVPVRGLEHIVDNP